jgi:hypothetical protein
MKLILASLFVVVSISSNCQVLNIDREIENDTIFRRVRASFNLNFSNDKQKKNLIDFSNTSELDLFMKNKYMFIFLTQTELSLNGLTPLENIGFFQLRFRDNDSRKIAPDIFTQYQWNGVQGMEHRAILGCNARARWLEKKVSDLYTGLGIFYEYEKWNPFLSSFAFNQDSLNIAFRKMFRLNATVKFALKITDNIDFAGTTFVQFPLNNHFQTPRWFFDSNVYFNVNKHLGFTIHYDHNFDTYRPLPIDTYYYTISTGINIKI